MSILLEAYIKMLMEADEDEEEAKQRLAMMKKLFVDLPRTVPKADPGIGSKKITAMKKQMSGPKTPGKTTSMTSGEKSFPTKPAEPDPTTKPKYRGHFVGQVAKLGSKVVDKNVAWWDKKARPEPTMKYGKVKGLEDANVWVWDGKDWVTPAAFNLKMRGECFDRIFEERCRTTR